MESTDVTFDDDNCPGLDGEAEDHEALNFENLPDLCDSEDEDQEAETQQTATGENEVADQEPNSPVVEGNNTGGGNNETDNQTRTMETGENSQENQHTRKWDRSHVADNIIGNPNDGVRTRRATMNDCLYASFLSQFEPKKIEEALLDPDWIIAI